MSDNSFTATQLNVLKKKLDKVIKSRSTLEEGFSHQLSQLIQFIISLSQVCKGIDLELDNKLANFRALLNKSAPMAEIQLQIESISKLLLKFSRKNDLNIHELHQQFHAASKGLQTIKNIPPQHRRNLRTLIQENQETKVAVTQYLSPLKQLISLYQIVLKSKVELSETVRLTDNNKLTSTKNEVDINVDQTIIEKFTILLNKLISSGSQYEKLTKIKKILTPKIAKNELLNCFIQTFDLIVININEELETTGSFLSSLSQSLSTVQLAVQSTLTINAQSRIGHNKLNAQLNDQVKAVSGVVDEAKSLTDIKEKIQNKLEMITKTITSKTDLERENHQDLEQQIKFMGKQIIVLEKQSNQFEVRLNKQKIKSQQDALTKLYNRAAFDEYFTKEMVRFLQHKFDLAIAVIDIDDFKNINDTYGHTAGDKTLQVIAKTMQDSLPNNVFIARYGGEEFVIIHNAIKKIQCVKLLNTIKSKIASLPFKFKNDKVTITISIGATHVHTDDNIHLAFERADKALYQAKASGKNSVIYLK